MVNTVSADALMSVLNAKYRFLFWRPVTAIEAPVVPEATVGGDRRRLRTGAWVRRRQPGDCRRPLLAASRDDAQPSRVPGGPRYEHVRDGRGLQRVPGHRPASTWTSTASTPPALPGNLDAVHHFDTAEQLRTEVINARLWGGIHYRRSSEVGVHLGQKVAHYGLNHAFKPTNDSREDEARAARAAPRP